MSYQPKYLGHVNIFVRNVERSHRWYADVLGLHTYGLRPGQVAFLSADREQSHEVALVQAGEDAMAAHGRHIGLNHMAWMMSSLDDLKELYQRLKERACRSSKSLTTAFPSAFTLRTRTAMGLRFRTSCHATNGPARNAYLRKTLSN